MYEIKATNFTLKEFTENNFFAHLENNHFQMIAIVDKIKTDHEAFRFIDENFEKFHRRLLVLNFTSVDRINYVSSLKLKAKTQYWGPQIIFISSRIFYFKNPDDFEFKMSYFIKNSATFYKEYQLRFDNNYSIHQILNGISSKVLGIEENNFSQLYITFNLDGLRPAILSSNILLIRFLTLFYDHQNENNIVNLISSSISEKRFKVFLDLIGLHQSTKMDEIRNMQIRKILQLKLDTGFNFLMLATLKGNIDVINFFLNHKLVDIDYETSNGITAIKIAHESNNLEILALFLKHDANYKDLSFKTILKCSFLQFSNKNRLVLKNILSDLEKLHILAKNDSKVSKLGKIIAKYPSMRYFYNSSGESIAASALKHKSFKIYEFLLKRGIFLRPNEDIHNLLGDNKLAIRNIHRNVLKLSYNEYIINVLKYCHVGHDVSDSEKPKYNELILRALNKLDNIGEIKNLLEIISVFDNLHLIFEFNRDTVDQLDPTTGKSTLGIFYLNGWIYIGAKGLKNPNEISEEYLTALGTIAHEICHLAMQLTFKNHAKPYSVIDIVEEAKYKEIINAYEINESNDSEIIQRVFTCYDKNMWPAELIVRVPEILAFYHDNPEKIREISNTHLILFNFFNTVQSNIKEKIIKIKVTKKMSFINSICGLEQETLSWKCGHKVLLTKDIDTSVTFLLSNCPTLTLLNILNNHIVCEKYLLLLRLNYLENTKFINIFNEIVLLRVEPKMIVLCDKKLENTKIDEILQKFKAKVTFLVDNKISIPKEYPSSTVVHTTEELVLSEFSCNELMVSFQGVLADFGNIFKLNTSEVDEIKMNIPLNVLFLKDPLLIGKEIKQPKNFYYERKFLDEFDSELQFTSLLNNNIILLADVPGMGKSTTFRKFSYDIKGLRPNYWVLYIDLKLYFTTFKKFKNLKDFSVKDIIEILSHMMKFGKVEEIIFSAKLRTKEVTLLFDGVDEISPDFKDLIVELICKIYKLTKLQIWIASRPHCVQELKENLNTFSFKLSPIDQESFLGEYFDFHKISEDEKKSTLSLIGFMRNEWNQEYDNPLIIIIAIEIINMGYIQDDERNLYAFYELYLDLKMEIIVKGEGKGPLRLKDKRDITAGQLKMKEFHQKMALKLLFKRLSVSENCYKELELMKVENPVDAIFGFGILYGKSYNECFFSHQTFLEFFVANYIVQNIFENLSSNEAENSIRLMVFELIFIDDSNKQIQRFIEYYLIKHEVKVKNNDQLSKISKLLTERLFYLVKRELPGFVHNFIDHKDFAFYAFCGYYGHLKNCKFEKCFSLVKSFLELQENLLGDFDGSLKSYWNLSMNIFGFDDAKLLLRNILGMDNLKYHFKIPSLKKSIYEYDVNTLKDLFNLILETFSREEIRSFQAIDDILADYNNIEQDKRETIVNLFYDHFDIHETCKDDFIKILISNNKKISKAYEIFLQCMLGVSFANVQDDKISILRIFLRIQKYLKMEHEREVYFEDKINDYDGFMKSLKQLSFVSNKAFFLTNIESEVYIGYSSNTILENLLLYSYLECTQTKKETFICTVKFLNETDHEISNIVLTAIKKMIKCNIISNHDFTTNLLEELKSIYEDIVVKILHSLFEAEEFVTIVNGSHFGYFPNTFASSFQFFNLEIKGLTEDEEEKILTIEKIDELIEKLELNDEERLKFLINDLRLINDHVVKLYYRTLLVKIFERNSRFREDVKNYLEKKTKEDSSDLYKNILENLNNLVGNNLFS